MNAEINYMKKNIGLKSYFRDNKRYADLVNGIGSNGKQYAKHTDLQELDTEEHGKARDMCQAIKDLILEKK